MLATLGLTYLWPSDRFFLGLEQPRVLDIERAAASSLLGQANVPCLETARRRRQAQDADTARANEAGNVEAPLGAHGLDGLQVLGALRYGVVGGAVLEQLGRALVDREPRGMRGARLLALLQHDAGDPGLLRVSGRDRSRAQMLAVVEGDEDTRDLRERAGEGARDLRQARFERAEQRGRGTDVSQQPVLVLRAPCIGRIPHRHRQHAVFAEADLRDGRLDGELLATAAQPDGLIVIHAAASVRPAHELRDVSLVSGAQARGNEPVEPLAEDLLTRVAEHALGTVVPLGDEALVVERDDRVRGDRENRGGSGFRPPQHRFALRPLHDVRNLASQELEHTQRAVRRAAGDARERR